MLPLLNLAVSCLTVILFPAIAVLFAEVLLAVTGRSVKQNIHIQSKRHRLAVLIPAHNEAARIALTLRSVSAQLRDRDRVLVIADNCTDRTAAIAANLGAEVIVRTDANRRGKGFALDYGIRHLESDPPDMVIVIDADCQFGDGACDRLAQLCAQSGRPVQSLYLMKTGPRPGLRMRIAEFAWAVKNQARAAGLHRLGLPCQLMGSGMAFPWPCIVSADLASGHIVEDLKLGLDLACAGTPPLFCPDALVTSTFCDSARDMNKQHTRWEHGHLSLILGQTPRLLLAGLRARKLGLIAMALDLSVPPLALLTLMVGALWAVSVFLYLRAGLQFSLALASVDLLLIGFSVLMAWRRYGREIISLPKLALSGVYALWKLPLYAKALVARQMHWVRSARAEDGAPAGHDVAAPAEVKPH